MKAFDHILILGFGGPETPGDVEGFVRHVAAGRNIPEERLQRVIRQYAAIGGGSPYTRHVLRFAEKLEGALKTAGLPLPVFTGMRHSPPFLKETIQTVAEKKFKKGIAFIFSPFRSAISCYRYKQDLSQALKQISGISAEYDYPDPCAQHPLFLQAHTAGIRDFLKARPGMDLQEVAFIFTAHAIPESMLGQCRECHYQNEFETSAAAVARALHLPRWLAAYQSRSGRPEEPWLGPDILETAGQVKDFGARKAVIVPLGFFCDNAEVLFDLDHAAKDYFRRNGLEYDRVSTVADSPFLIAMAAEMIADKIKKEAQ